MAGPTYRLCFAVALCGCLSSGAARVFENLKDPCLLPSTCRIRIEESTNGNDHIDKHAERSFKVIALLVS